MDTRGKTKHIPPGPRDPPENLLTERKQAEETLQEADRREDAFLGMLAYALRNPLAPIRNAVEILKCLDLQDPKLPWIRDLIDRNLAHMTQLVDNLLDSPHITHGKRVVMAGGDQRLASRKGRVARLRVLVVDDDADVLNSTAMLLGLIGHEVRTAGDGPAALDAVRAFRPHAILLDIELPGMDGYEVARRLCARSETKQLLIAMTGYGQAIDCRRTQAAGFDHHLVKPIDAAALEALLNSAADDGEYGRIPEHRAPRHTLAGEFAGDSRSCADTTEPTRTEERVEIVTPLQSFTAMMAHQLNQPLMAMVSYVEGGRRVFSDAAGADPLFAEFLDELARLTQRAAEVVRLLRDYGQALGCVSVDVNQVIIDALRLSGGERQGRLTLALAADLPRAAVNPAVLLQVLCKLLSGALKRADGSAGHLNIQSLLTPIPEIAIQLIDTAPGVKESGGRLFDPLAQREAGQRGFEIFRALIEQGRFWVHLNPASESIYTITLPIEDSGDAV